MAGRGEHLDRPYPGGEAGDRPLPALAGSFMICHCDGRGEQVLVIGHVATRRGLYHFIDGTRLEDLIEQDFGWQEGWEYQLS